MARAIDEAYGPEECRLPPAHWTSLAGRVRPHAMILGALVERRISISHLDGDAPLQFLAVRARPYSRYGLSKAGLAMVNVPGGAYVDLGLLRKRWFFRRRFDELLLRQETSLLRRGFLTDAEKSKSNGGPVAAQPPDSTHEPRRRNVFITSIRVGTSSPGIP